MSTYFALQIINIVDIAFQVLIWLIIIRVILSWVRHDPYNPVIKFIYEVTDVVMKPFHRIIPTAGGIDFSPIIIIFILSILQRVVHDVLFMILTGF
ncbi:MAG: YggT family protein [Syntrophomonadaceae bacterium]|nr:YggT family protein [Syntrophomonadaceae bacterium]